MHDLHVPPELSLEQVAHMLSVGHGYRWRNLLNHPQLISHGTSPMGAMPEILLVGPNCLIINTDDLSVVERLHHMIELLMHQPLVSKEVMR